MKIRRSRWFLLLLGLPVAIVFVFSWSSANSPSVLDVEEASLVTGAPLQHRVVKTTLRVQERAAPSYPDGRHKLRNGHAGHVFGSTEAVKDLHADLTTSVIYSFSPEIEELVSQMYLDPFHENRYKGLAPAIEFFSQKDGVEKIITAQRIWLSQYDTSFNKNPTDGFKNTFPENIVYKRLYSGVWRPETRGGMMGIPATTNCAYGYRSDGVMDPRLFRWQGRLFLSFHMWHHDSDDDTMRGRMMVWDTAEHRIHKLQLNPDFVKRLQRTEINWVPLVLPGDKLHYIYSLDPLRVMKCDKRLQCVMSHLPPGEESLDQVHKQQEDGVDHYQPVLRGGTQFQALSWPYYVSVAHTQMKTIDGEAVYAANLLIMAAAPTFRIVYVSEPLRMDPAFLNSTNITRSYVISKPFIYPVGLILRGDDVLDVGVHLNDQQGFIVRLRGFAKLFADVKRLDSGSTFTSHTPFMLPNYKAAVSLASYHKLQRNQVIFPEYATTAPKKAAEPTTGVR